MTHSCTIILNDKAGALKSTPGLEQLQQMCAEIGLDAEVITATSPKNMRTLIRKRISDGVKKIVVAGGDGTVRLAAQELAHSDAILGIIPQGTFNNFATALKIPLSLPAALRAIKDGKYQEVSLGKINEHYFTEAAGVGLFADALALYGTGNNKNLFRGVLAIVSVLFSFPRHRVKITIDGKTVVERATMCTVANSFRLGQGFPIAPEAKLTDDVLDIIIVGDLRRRELFQYYRALRAQLHPNLPKVTTLQGKTITIEATRSLNVHCDDQVPTTTPVTLSIEPKALKVLVETL